jgi:hypothetical protein
MKAVGRAISGKKWLGSLPWNSFSYFPSITAGFIQQITANNTSLGLFVLCQTRRAFFPSFFFARSKFDLAIKYNKTIL